LSVVFTALSNHAHLTHARPNAGLMLLQVLLAGSLIRNHFNPKHARRPPLRWL
jgi:uncharacterized membrane protein